MVPILFSIGSVHIFSFSVFIVAGWLVYSFLLWKQLVAQAVEEERIFDLTFYSTIVALIAARAGFIAAHPDVFAGAWIKMLALWVQPGLSVYAGLFGGLATLVFLSRQYKVRVSYVLDALPGALVGFFVLGEIGALLDGSPVGFVTSLPWAVRYAGHTGLRHPVQLYELGVLVVIWLVHLAIARRADQKQWAYGLVGVWFFILFSLSFFWLELFKESSVYWAGLRANQWFLVVLFAESVGVLFVRGGGREAMRPKIQAIVFSIKQRLGGIYGTIFRRRSGQSEKTT